MLGLRFCGRAFSSCGERGLLFIAVRGPLTIAASLIAEHRLQTRRLSSCGSQAQLLCGMWDLPRPGLEPVSPALAGGFLTAPPGKPPSLFFILWYCTAPFLLSFFLFFLLCHEACGVSVPRPEVRPKLLCWELWVQTTGLTENLRCQRISIRVRPPRGPHLSTKTQLYLTYCKLQCWMSQAKHQ